MLEAKQHVKHLIKQRMKHIVKRSMNRGGSKNKI
jgi:hypothetical protein